MSQDITIQPGDYVIVRAATTGSPVTPPPVVIPPPVDTGRPTLLYVVPWETMVGYLHTSGFVGGMDLAIQFTVPSSYRSIDASRISGAEFGGGPNARDSVISIRAYDFINYLPNSKSFGNPIVQYWMQVGGSSASRTVLQAGHTYFCNIRSPGVAAGVPCEMSITMMVPVSS